MQGASKVIVPKIHAYELFAFVGKQMYNFEPLHFEVS
jgi:hypothetical protein